MEYTGTTVAELYQKHLAWKRLLNPTDLLANAEKALSGSPSGRTLLQQFQINTFTYHQISTSGLGPNDEEAAKEIGLPVQTDLMVHIAIPLRYAQAPETTAEWIPFIRWHGGGGVSAGRILLIIG